MVGLIESLLDYAWVERSELQRTSVDLGMFANLALAELQETRPDPASPRPARVSVAQDLSVEGDERQLRMLMTELVRNSWNFSNGEVVLDVSGERVGDRLRIAVRSEGSGFDMQYLSKLFEPFQRLHGADEGEGNGLGLAIAQRRTAEGRVGKERVSTSRSRWVAHHENKTKTTD